MPEPNEPPVAEPAISEEDWGESEDSASTPTVLPDPLQKDYKIYRWAVASLSSTIVLSVIAGTFLTFMGKEVPQMIVAIASACVGALGAMLSPNRN